MSAPSMTMTNNNNKVQNHGLLSSSLIEEETNMKQGIITILDSNNNMSSASPLRRALSGDMSSKKWLNNNIASSQEDKMNSNLFSSTHHEVVEAEDEAERERLEIWSSIQRNKKAEQEKAGEVDTWSSIMSLKGNDEISKSLPVTPYVHPLVKRSKSSLSEKSLEICTESLGSETGSDGLLFCSYPSSETGETEEEKEQVEKVPQEEEQLQHQDLHVSKNNYPASLSTKKGSPPRAFPPPLPSLSHQQTGPSLQMHSHRQNGRLVLQAVSVPSLNNFNVQREDGRLVLTFADSEEEEDEENHDDDNTGVEEEEDFEEDCFGGVEFEEVYFGEGKEEYEGEEEEEEEEEEEGDVRDMESSVMEKVSLVSSGITSSSVHRLALMMNKPIELVNRNPNWSEKINEMTKFEDVNVVKVETSQVAKSLSPRVARLFPSTQTMASFNFNSNSYEYYWRKTTKPTSTKPLSVSVNQLHKDHQHNNDLFFKSNCDINKVVVSRDINKVVSNEQQQLLVLRGKNGDYLVHNWKSCKDSRSSFLFWEPYCIATS